MLEFKPTRITNIGRAGITSYRHAITPGDHGTAMLPINGLNGLSMLDYLSSSRVFDKIEAQKVNIWMIWVCKAKNKMGNLRLGILGVCC